jgi:3-isopropylmalate/(R)-2-methylmalate dehydratase small subunit
MNAFTSFSAPLAQLPVDNIDTDQIIPARFLTTTTRLGLGKHCFNDWRYDAAGQPRGDFALGAVVAAGHSILLAGRNFGCGSSREHAPWALLDFGIRVVISTQIADIFRSNALKNGLLPIVVSEAEHAHLCAQIGQPLGVDLEAGRLQLADGSVIAFHTEAFARMCLLRGVDQLGYLVDAEDEIARFEAAV